MAENKKSKKRKPASGPRAARSVCRLCADHRVELGIEDRTILRGPSD